VAKLKGKLKDKKRKSRLKEEKDRKSIRKNRLLDLIRTFNDPVLSHVCEDVRKTEDKFFIYDMISVLRVAKDGVGLAANQIGVAKNVFVMLNKLLPGKVNVFINPVVMPHQLMEMTTYKEGCLSYPGFYYDIHRFKEVKIAYEDIDFVHHEKLFTGLQSIVVQHEMEHLIGFCKVGNLWKQERIK
jgi:peptide deformylase